MSLPRLPKQVMEKARSFACTLYKQVPGALIPNAGEDGLRFIWDNLCDPPSNPQDPPLPGLPPKPVPPINGGQCPCKPYNVRISYTYDADSSPGDQLVTAVQNLQVLGALGGTRVVTLPSDADGTTRRDIEILCRGFFGEQCRPSQVWRTAVSRIPNYRSHVTQNLGTVDGTADNCGELPKQYPSADPPPPNGYTSPPTNITLNDGDNINITFNLKPPLAPLPPATRLPPIVVNVGSPKLNIPISFEFNGDINIGEPTSPPMSLPPDVVDDINNINNNTSNTNINLNNFINDYNFNTSPPPFATSPEVTKTPIGVGSEGEKDDVEELLGVLVELEELPDKAQFGTPNCYFAGWITFKTQSGQFPREQINFEKSYFEAPPGSTGVSYTFTNGAKGALTLYSKTVEQ